MTEVIGRIEGPQVDVVVARDREIVVIPMLYVFFGSMRERK